MRLYDLFCGITMALSKAESEVIAKVSTKDAFPAEKLTQHEQYLCNELYIKGILHKKAKDSIIYYYIERETLDRDPLL